MVRNAAFEWVQRLARKKGYSTIVEGSPSFSSIEELVDALAPYWDEHDEILLDGGSRSGHLFTYDGSTGEVTQILRDPDDTNEWRITAKVDRDASIEAGRAVLILQSISPVGA